MNPHRTPIPEFLAALAATIAIPVISAADPYDTGRKVFALSPNPASIKPLGHIGPQQTTPDL